MSTRALNLMVFRDGRRCVSGRKLLDALCDEPALRQDRSEHDDVLGALLRAGELECGVADSGAAEASERLTDQLADILVDRNHAPALDRLDQLVSRISLPEEIQLSVSEGFAFYALHPLAYADAVAQLGRLSRDVVVIGIRSIGTTLSAVTAAAVRKTGGKATRFTVRPSGHPYNRCTQFNSEQAKAVQRAIQCDADWLVVDEGPGLSGSSFLSVAEALAGAGVADAKITLICGHQPNFADFCCPDGRQRAARFRWIAAQSETRKPLAAERFVGAGEWRQHLLSEGAEWPASWTSFERAKYLSAIDHPEPRLFKFAGYGHYADELFQREDIFAQAGFGPRPSREAQGFISYARLKARPMSRGDLNEAVLLRLADYCAFRRRTFRTLLNSLDPLQRMAEHNLQQLQLDIPIDLQLERPVIADARMQPHEWLLSPDGHLWKTDSGSHGDDHFFPGPTDIAWDLAGAIVEWQMSPEQSEVFLSRYEGLSSDKASKRIGDYLIAYSAFRCAYCLMAANALSLAGEPARLERSADLYRGELARYSAVVFAGS